MQIIVDYADKIKALDKIIDDLYEAKKQISDDSITIFTAIRNDIKALDQIKLMVK